MPAPLPPTVERCIDPSLPGSALWQDPQLQGTISFWQDAHLPPLLSGLVELSWPLAKSMAPSQIALLEFCHMPQ